MTLITKVELKEYLRRPAGETAEDNLLDRMILAAKGLIQKEVAVPITAATRTWTDRAETQSTLRPVRSLLLPRPIATAGLVVVDGDGRTLAAAEYDTTELTENGLLYAARGYSFPNGPYQGTATIGLSVHPDYGTEIEPVVNAIIQDLCAEWYQSRRPGAASETDPGAGVTSFPDELPPRCKLMLRQISHILP